MIRVYTDMVADMFHIGHLNLIKRARSYGDCLVVGVHSDKDVSSYKRSPIIAEEQRYEIVKACSFVDEVIEAAPLTITEEFIKEYKIDLIVRGDDVSAEHVRQQAVAIELGIMRYLPRTKGVSSTSIIKKIKAGNY